MNLGINDIKELTASMSQYTGMDYSEYTLSFLKRRLDYVFTQLNIKRKEHFMEFLPDNSFRENIIRLMCVEVTEMFRDPAFWRTFRDDIIQKIPEQCNTIWLPNETSGEETFSLAIILHESNLGDKYNIICNNPSKEICNNILEGRINAKHHDINQTNYKRLEHNDYYNSYFKKENGFMILDQKIKNKVQCRNSSFISDSPEEKIGVILFRNSSLYYNQKLMEKVFQQLIEILMPGGFLAIGVKEQLPKDIEEDLIIIDRAEKIYQKPDYKQSNFHG